MQKPSSFRVLTKVAICLVALSFLLAIAFQAKLGTWGRAETSPAARGFIEAAEYPGTLIGVQYETWFTPKNAGGWDTAEAIPILGKYSSYDVNVQRKHEEWFEYLGVDWLLLDWSNMLWTKPAWEEHTGATRELEETTDLLFKTYSQLEKEGKHPPKLVIMLGLQNGPPVPNALQRLNGIIEWTKKNFLDKPEYKNLWLYYQGKPLLTILFFTPRPCEDLQKVLDPAPLIAPDWTVRWMASQLQDTHAENCGMWSWMDGTIRQLVTRNQGLAEETVVTPACFPFPRKGWLHPDAVGRDHGTPYVESWKVAFGSRPRFIQIHQWNEFAGQKEGEGFPQEYWEGRPSASEAKPSISSVYGDEYNLEFSDDIEPTQLGMCAYRGCGGWGYYYMNLTKALISLYRNETPDITVMALSSPFNPVVVKGNNLPLSWRTMGRSATSYTVKVDGRTVAEKVQGQEYTLDLSKTAAGKHQATVIAEGAHTYFDLSPEKMTERSKTPLPVRSSIEFTYSPPAR